MSIFSVGGHVSCSTACVCVYYHYCLVGLLCASCANGARRRRGPLNIYICLYLVNFLLWRPLPLGHTRFAMYTYLRGCGMIDIDNGRFLVCSRYHYVANLDIEVLLGELPWDSFYRSCLESASGASSEPPTSLSLLNSRSDRTWWDFKDRVFLEVIVVLRGNFLRMSNVQVTNGIHSRKYLVGGIDWSNVSIYTVQYAVLGFESIRKCCAP